MNTFHGALSRGAFLLTVELTCKDEEQAGVLVRQAFTLAKHFDGVQLGEAPPAMAGISPTALAALLLREGIDAIPTLSCRDRNRIALQSEILGLRALGVTSMVLKRGDGNSETGQAAARPVFDVNGRELIAMASEIDEARLLLGTEARVPTAGSDWSSANLLERATAGARFLRLRPCPDLEPLRLYMARLVDEKATWKFSVIPSLSPEQLGIDHCAQMIRDASAIPGVSGINLVCRDDPELVIATLRSSGITSGT